MLKEIKISWDKTIHILREERLDKAVSAGFPSYHACAIYGWVVYDDKKSDIHSERTKLIGKMFDIAKIEFSALTELYNQLRNGETQFG